MALTTEYFSLLQKYKEKYGKATILFMQVGSFFEVYSKTEDDEDMVNFSNACELKIATKVQNKTYMAGFRDYVLDKYIQKFISNSNYTIVVFNQKDKGGVITREEFGIYSPGTVFNDTEILSNNITCIWIHKTNKVFTESYIFGLSTLDTYTGTLYTNEYTVPYYHNPTTYDEIEKHISVYNPIELIIIYDIDESHMENVLQYINHKSKKITKISLNASSYFSEQAIKCENQSYQEEIIKRFYPITEKNTMIDNLFDHIISFQSLCFLLNFVEQHNPGLTKKLNEPLIENEQSRLILANHTLKQLNILDGEQSLDKEYSSVLSLLNVCKTKMGKRKFHQLLVNPTRDVSVLNKSYELTDHMIKFKYDWKSYLNPIKDIEKILRKKVLNKCSPLDYYYIYDFCVQLEGIINTLDPILLDYIKSDNTSKIIYKIKRQINDFFNVPLLSSINSCMFEKYPEYIDELILRGNDDKLDKMIQHKLESKDKLISLVDYLNEIYKTLDKKIKTNVIKLHETSSGVSLQITKRRGNILLKELSKHSSIHLKFTSSYTNNTESFMLNVNEIITKEYNLSTYTLRGSFIDDITNQLYRDCSSFYKYFNDVYSRFYDVLIEEDLQELIIVIQSLDILHCKKEIAVTHDYCRPIIEESDISFLDIKELRHPLIEKIESNELYVSNDICLGKNNNGMLLFGTNAVGKTSFIKSIGIAVLMAQAGLYVPCKEMVYCPYEYIFTRIIGNDNIFKGLSTFGVEMSELRVILKYCNDRSLILGDELCSGTEMDSALSIFVAGLEHMYKQKSSFIFATHFHQIQYFNEIKEMDQLQLKHLTVEYNNKLDTLIYNRKLQDGAGESIYGLEVCKSLNMPDKFIDRSYEIRNKYDKSYNNILTFKKSKYNKDKIRGMCEFCNEELGTEIHHLKYQKSFKNTQLHHKGNLSGVCEKCHNNIHSLGLVYEKKKTLDGEYKIILIHKN